MMVGHDYINAVILCKQDILVISSAKINRHDERHAISDELLDCRTIESVALMVSIGNID